MDFTPTPSQTVGPFFHCSLTSEKHRVQRIAGPEVKGERIWLRCRVFDGAGEPVNDAMIEIWQADTDGHYHSGNAGKARNDSTPDHENRAVWGPRSFRGFGRMSTDEDGSCEFETIKPGPVTEAGSALQAPHLNVAVFGRGLLKQLFTRIYFAGEPANQADPLLLLAPEARRDTLMAHRDSSHSGYWLFDIHLQGEKETVFFDV